MAYELNMQTISVPASADLSTKQFQFGTINASGQVAVTGAGLASDGVIALGAAAQGRPCALAATPGQIVRVAAGAAFANGALLEVDGTGRAITQAAGKILAKALAAAGAAGDIVPALLILMR
jgi:hypothetical protein